MADAKAKALEAKEKGNRAFKSSDFPTAIGHYTTACLADPTDLTFSLNRAAAYLKLDKYQDAERDCTTVLRLSTGGKNIKALFRRGQARRGLGKLEDAEKDFAEALALEPANASTKQELEEVRELLRKEKERRGKTPITVSPGVVPIASTPTSTTTAAAASVASSSSQGSTPAKRRRVPIRIIGEQDDGDVKRGKGKEKEQEKEQEQETMTSVVNVNGTGISGSGTTNGKTKSNGTISGTQKRVDADNETEFMKPVSSRSLSLRPPSTTASGPAASTVSFASTVAYNDQTIKTPAVREEEEKKRKEKDEEKEQTASVDEEMVTDEFEAELAQALHSTMHGDGTMSATTTGIENPEPKLKPTPGLKYTSSPSTSTPDITTQADKAASNANDSFQKAKQARDASKPSRVGGGIFRATGENVIFGKPSSSEGKLDAVVKENEEKEKVTEDEDKSAESLTSASKSAQGEATSAASPIPARIPAKPTVAPQTLFEFSRMWDNALSSSKGKGNEEVVWDRWGLICAIPPTQLPTLFKTSLEPALLVSILDIFLKVLQHPSGNPNENSPEKVEVLEYLTSLARVPRFNTLILFLSRPEKELSKEVWAQFGVQDPVGIPDPKVRGVWRGIWG